MSGEETESDNEDENISEGVVDDDRDQSESENETQSTTSLADYPTPAIDINSAVHSGLSDGGSASSHHNDSNFGAGETVAATSVGIRSRRRGRRKQLPKRYTHAYLELFNRSFDPELLDHDDAHEEEFLDSQLGAVTWSASEKARFFRALSKYGRHDLPKLSNAVGTKSQLEVKVYLDLLHEAFVDRQIFERETKNVSHAEIAAAVEIGPRFEDVLEQAADAVQAMQEKYDFAAGQLKAGERWLIDRDGAKRLQVEEAKLDDGGITISNIGMDDDSFEDSIQNDNAFRLLHLKNWLDLTEEMFMNQAPGGTYDDWTIIAEDGQRPSLTTDAVRDFRHLTISLTQRIMQVAIFQAKSRIRSTMDALRPKAQIVSKADIHAALDMLDMDHDAWEFWIQLPRRNNLKPFIFTQENSKKTRAFVAFSEAERYLSKMSQRRLSRSGSTSTSRSRRRSSLSDLRTSDLDFAAAETLNEDVGTGSTSEVEDESSADEHVRDDSSIDHSENESNLSMNSNAIDDMSGLTNMRREKRRLFLEEAQDEYMERIDQNKRRKHEAELSQILGPSLPSDIKSEDEEEDETGTRPKTLRKTKEEFGGWSCSYQPEWEQYFRRHSTHNGASGLEDPEADRTTAEA